MHIQVLIFVLYLCLFVDPSVRVINWLYRLQDVLQVDRSTPTLDTITRDWKNVSPQGQWFITNPLMLISTYCLLAPFNCNVSLFFLSLSLFTFSESMNAISGVAVMHRCVLTVWFSTVCRSDCSSLRPRIRAGAFVVLMTSPRAPLFVSMQVTHLDFSLFKRTTLQCLVLPKLFPLIVLH